MNPQPGAWGAWRRIVQASGPAAPRCPSYAASSSQASTTQKWRGTSQSLPKNQYRHHSSWRHSGQSNRGGQYGNRWRRSRLLLASTGAAGAGASVLAFTDDIKAGYDSVERSGRVVSTLFVCIQDYRRTLRKREAVQDAEEQDSMLKACHKRCAERTLKVLEKNGGIFIKLGQHLSAMNYLLPEEWTVTFVPLQDKCPVSSFDSITDMFEGDTAMKLMDYFSEFNEVPIGAASLAQVHLATIRETGQRVAVKVQHPVLDQWAHLDLALTRYAFATVKKFFPEYDLEWLASEMSVSLPKELDFEQEAANAIRAKAHFAAIPSLPVVIPEVIWARRRILVMAYESGHRPDDLQYLDGHGIDRDDVAAALAHIFNEMIFGNDAPLHCDPHGGNIAIRENKSRGRNQPLLLRLLRPWRRRPNFDVILYDHGLYRDIPQDLRRSYAKMWLAVIDGDIDRMRTYAQQVAGIGDDEFPLFLSAITGRDYSIVRSQGSVLKQRTADEKKTMSTALQEGLLADLVQLLGRVPRIILLILKTNDLTRSLDENLHTKQGPVRSFLILARYCTRTVFHEQVEQIRAKGSLLWPGNAASLLVAWLGFMRVELKLKAFETYLSVKRHLGFQAMEMDHLFAS